jgi:hypothetical protein
LENALSLGDGQKAIIAFKDLPDEAQKKLDIWEEGLEKRDALDHALQDMMDVFTAPTTQGTFP